MRRPVAFLGIVVLIAVAVAVAVILATGDGDDQVTPTPAAPPSPDEPQPSMTPADSSGSDIVPTAGRWEFVSAGSVMACNNGLDLPIPASPPEQGTIDVSDGGAEIVASNFTGDTDDFTAQRSEASATGATYIADVVVEFGDQTGGVTLRYTIEFDAATHANGLLEGVVEVQDGLVCQVERPLEGELVG